MNKFKLERELNNSDSSDFDPRNQLNKVNNTYYEAINPTHPNELHKSIDKIQILKKFTESPVKVMTIGVGGGVELKALDALYNKKDLKVFGLDVSENAICAAQNYLSLFPDLERRVTFYRKNISEQATQLPNSNMDVIVASSVLHEIFSYSANGTQAVKNSLSNMFNLLSDDGVLLIRDFAGPTISDSIDISFLDNTAVEFYEFFSKYYRKFASWNESDKILMQSATVLDNSEITINKSLVNISASTAGEMILHFKNYLDHIKRGIIAEEDTSWKELDEVYLFLSALSTNSYNSFENFLELILTTANENNTPIQVAHIQRTEKNYKSIELAKYFKISDESGEDVTQKFIQDCSCKFEIIIKKRKI